LGLKLGDLLGLDIGSSSVKLVQLTRNGDGYETVAAGRVQIEFNGDKNAREVEIQRVRAVTECCRQAGISNKYAVSSVCGPDVAVRYFRFPVIPAEELTSAIKLEAEQVCPFGMDDSVLDYQIIPDEDESVHGVLVAATDKVIRQKEKIMREASLNPVLMDVDGLALWNCLSEFGRCQTNQALAVLNVGNIYSTLVIADEKCVPFVRDTNNAGKSVIKNLLSRTGLSREKLDQILFGDASGSSGSNDNPDIESQKLVDSSLEAACQELIEDVTGTLRFYSAQRKTLFVEQIFVCGGFARAKGFIDIMDRNLPAQAVLWNPFEKIPCRADSTCKELLQNEGPSLAVAAGLAMRSV
jgi:type IV pilus assembly protein PilM